jgi:hypothetical protein
VRSIFPNQARGRSFRPALVCGTDVSVTFTLSFRFTYRPLAATPMFNGSSGDRTAGRVSV